MSRPCGRHSKTISGHDGLELVGSGASAKEAVELARTMRPDVILLDVRLPGGGPAAADGILQSSPGTAVIAISAYTDRGTVGRMMAAGASPTCSRADPRWLRSSQRSKGPPTPGSGNVTTATSEDVPRDRVLAKPPSQCSIGGNRETGGRRRKPDSVADTPQTWVRPRPVPSPV